MRSTWLALSAALMLMVSGIAGAEDRVERFHGHAFDLDSGNYIYTEVHEQTIVGGDWVSGKIGYFDPSGQKIGEKTLDFSADPYVPIYHYELPALGYKEGITRIDNKIHMSKTSDGETDQDSVKKKDPITADSGFHNFLLKHFDQLMGGETVKFTFVAAGNLDSFKFRARRIEDGTFDGIKAARFKVEADSLLRLVAPDLTVSYDPENRKLLEYVGPSNVINKDSGRVYDARIIYPAAPPPGAPAELPPLQ